MLKIFATDGTAFSEDDFFFASTDSETCSGLSYHIIDARDEGLEEITLVEAVIDFYNKDFIWCTYHGECVERVDCKKSYCPKYSSTSGRGVCKHKGKLYQHGAEYTFKTDIEWKG